MRLNVRFREQNETFSGMQETDQTIGVNFGTVNTKTENDYNHLVNRPSINSVTLEGALDARDLGLGKVYYDTTANWDFQRSLVSEEAAIYIYSDYDYTDDGNGNQVPIAGIKIGDGNAYLIDLPFLSDLTTKLIVEHMANTTVHVTAEERAFWNNKVSSFIDFENEENLVLSKTKYETDGTLVTG